jgi:hypothetical protein
MAKVKQLTVSLENRPGALAEVAQLLAGAKVNVVALLGSAAGSAGSAQFVVDQAGKAKKVLAKAGLSFTEGTLEAFEMANKPGVLAEVAGKLAKKGLNIDCAFATTAKGGKKATLMVAVSKPTNVAALLDVVEIIRQRG